jgi:Ser/Thr protein kinase RdoA (MazF antagonist)
VDRKRGSSNKGLEKNNDLKFLIFLVILTMSHRAGSMRKYITEAAEQFSPQSPIIDIREYGNGNINKTFLVTLDNEGEKHFILQCINTQVFRHPELVARNIRIVTGHIHNRLRSFSPEERRWEIPHVRSTRDGHDFWLDPGGSFWRASSFIDRSQTFDTIKNTAHAKEVGYGLGMFHNLISDLPPDRLSDTLKGFHITPLYLKHYRKVLAKHKPDRSPEVEHCLKFISERNAFANVLESAWTRGRLRLSVIHGDPKVNNILIDTDTGKAVCLIDLDTVRPGLLHYDIGDCLRSGCNPAGEETEQVEKVSFDIDLCRAILQGYLSVAREFLSLNDFDFLYDSIRLLTFELGLRFFTDFLEGNVYFRVSHPKHNLIRALVQFRLTASIESQEEAVRTIIKSLK